MSADVPVTDNPFDHNVECRFCDEQAGHRGDCPWLEALIEERVQLRAGKADAERMLAESRATLTAEIERLLDEAEGAREQVTDLVAKLQLLVNCLDERGQLGEEHVFTFPDGDTWKAQPWPR